MKIEKVSIVIPTYNGAKYIHRSIDSCLNQTYKYIELIIVDDGSADRTPQIIQSYKDKRIKYIRHEKNKGLPHALNTGFANTTGSYLTWTSDDNFYGKDAIEKMLSFLKNKNQHFIYCDYYKFKNNNYSEFRLEKLPVHNELEYGNHIGACFLYTRKVFETIGEFDTEVELAEDYDYWIRVSKKFPMYHLNEPFYFYRVHKESLYGTRYFEVKIVCLLVMIKNDLISINQVTNLFINLIAKTRNRVYEFKILTRIFYSRQIKNIFRAYQIRQISVEDAKLSLKRILI